MADHATSPSDRAEISSAPGAGDVGSRASEAVAANFAHTVARLGQLVRIPSVSWDAFDPDHVRASADRVAELLRATGAFPDVQTVQAEIRPGVAGQPAVIAHRPAKPGYPSVTLYAHHDVQPEGDHDAWQTPPFEPTIRGERLYGRGASDDKAGVLLHVAAVEALMAAAGPEFGLGITVFIEGEEENGSGSFPALLAEHSDTLRADAIVVADSDNPDVNTPGLTVSLRGNITFELTVRTMAHAWHSGMFGGAVPDAMLATIRLLNSLWDADGSVAITGLHRAAGDCSHRDEAAFRAEAELLDGVSTIGTGALEHRITMQPAITVTGIDAPTVANASNTLAPEVRVRVSVRLAPGEDLDRAEAAIRGHLAANTPFGAHIEVANLTRGAAFLANPSGPWATALLESMREGWGVAPALTGIGGSIPFIADFAKMFPAAEILVTGVEDPQTMAHSPNESQHLGVLRRAIDAEARFLARMNVLSTQADTVAGTTEPAR